MVQAFDPILTTDALLRAYLPFHDPSLAAGSPLHVVVGGLPSRAVDILGPTLYELEAKLAGSLTATLAPNAFEQPAQPGLTAYNQLLAPCSLRELLPSLAEQKRTGILLLIDLGATIPLIELGSISRRLGRTDMLVPYQAADARAHFEQANEGELPHRTILELDRLYGSRHWREAWASFDAAAVQDAALRTIYMQALTELSGSRLRWSAALEVQTAWGQALFDWVFASSERAAGAAMSTALYQVLGAYTDSETGFLHGQTAGRPTQTSLFDAAPPSAASLQAAKIDRIQESLAELCKTQPRLWSFGDLRDALLKQGWFGQCTTAQIQTACEALAAQGWIVRRDTTAAWSERSLLRLQTAPSSRSSS